MIIVTGSAGFIGSQIALDLARKNPKDDLVVVDRLGDLRERPYLRDIQDRCRRVDAEEFLNVLSQFKTAKVIVHMGAITNTAEQDEAALRKWNVDYTKSLWQHCTQHKIPFIYASSAATYGDGRLGFSDDHRLIPELKPLNLYGKSKHEFDLFALSQSKTPPLWYGLKYFNVYGPHENHKGRMASAVWHGYHEIRKTEQMTLFRSHNPKYKDGHQARDFIFIEDVLSVIDFLQSSKPMSGIYNLGTGEASTFLELANALFTSLKKPINIRWVDTPPEFRAAYQYSTQAEVGKLRHQGYIKTFTSLSEGVAAYARYLDVSIAG